MIKHTRISKAEADAVHKHTRIFHALAMQIYNADIGCLRFIWKRVRKAHKAGDITLNCKRLLSGMIDDKRDDAFCFNDLTVLEVVGKESASALLADGKVFDNVTVCAYLDANGKVILKLEVDACVVAVAGTLEFTQREYANFKRAKIIDDSTWLTSACAVKPLHERAIELFGAIIL